MDSIFTIAIPTLFLLYKCVLHLACGNLHMVSHVCRPQAAILSWSPIDHLCWRNILQPICLRSTYSGLYREQRIFIKSPELVSKGLMLIIDSSIIHWFFCQSWGLKVLLSPGPELIAFLHLNLSGSISLVAQMRKNLSAMWKNHIHSLDGGDPLEKGMATQSSILAWRIPWMKSLAVYSSWGHKKLEDWEHIQAFFGIV